MKEWIAEQCLKVGFIRLDRFLLNSIFQHHRQIEAFCKAHDLAFRVHKKQGLFEFCSMEVRL